MNELQFKIGNIIKDIEDKDCYFEGIITSINPIKYKVTTIIWNGEVDSCLNGKVISPKWWYVELKNKTV